MPAHELNPAVTAAEASVAAKASAVAGDPDRPVYHFRPPCCWMNDPNGTIYHDGWYHVFYQFNPYADVSGTIHWGHTRSRDLVHWEQLPVAVWPSTELGEEACWSGCASVTAAGEPILVYTSRGTDNVRPFEQWAALGDAEWLTWRKHPQNPILALGKNGVPEFEPDWRDPFIFHSGERTFLVLGAATPEQANVVLFETDDSDLVDWRYRGPIYSQPRSQMRFCECPNFFPLDGKYVLLLSPYNTVVYAVGEFDADQPAFTPETHGILDPGVSRLDHRGQEHDFAEHANYYATNILFDADDNCILLGWVRGFHTKQGWNGCLALPRVLTLGADGRPRQQPVPALKDLRMAQLAEVDTLRIENTTDVLPDVAGDTLELELELTLETSASAGLRLRCGSGSECGIQVTYDRARLRVNDTSVEMAGGLSIKLHIFLDRTVLELFVDDGVHAVTQVAYAAPEDQEIQLFAEGGSALFSNIRAWRMGSIW